MARNDACWGIDVGDSAVKALRLERVDDDSVRVVEHVVLPHKRVLSTPGIDAAEATRVALGALVSRFGEDLLGEQVAISVPGHSSFARFAKLPPVEPKGIPGLVKFEAAQQIPFPIEEVEWDYQVFASDDQPDIEVGIMAITRQKISELLSLYEGAGLTPTTITISPMAVYNAVGYDLGFTEDTPGTVIVDVGVQATDLIVAEAGRVWVRTFPIGGHHFTEALADAFKLDYTKAEKLKLGAETSKYKKQVFQALQGTLSDLIGDIQRSISYYQDTHPGSDLQRVIGAGSTFKLLGMRKLLSQQLKMEVYRLEEFKRIGVEGADSAEFQANALNMASAYGLALQTLGLTPVKANLMPTDVVRRALWKRKVPYFAATAGLGVLAGVASFLNPFLADMSRVPLSNYSAISQAPREAERIKSDWNSRSSAAQPSYLISNAFMLTDQKGLMQHVIHDVGSLIHDASSNLTSSQLETSPLAFELETLRTTYIAPEGFLSVEAPRPSGRRGMRSRRNQGPELLVAGERGAVRVEVSLQSVHDHSRAFLQQNVISWLEQNRDRVGVPYTIAERSKPQETDPEGDLDISKLNIEVVQQGDGAEQQQGNARRRPEGGRGEVPRGFGPANSRQRSGDGQTGNTELDKLAPIDEPEVRYSPEEKVTRYSITLVLELRDPSESEPETSEEQAMSNTNTNGGEL